MDKIVDALFVFRGEGIVENFPGNYSDFRAYESSDHKEIEEKVVEKIAEKKVEKKSSKNTLSFDEKREFGSLETEIERLQKRKLKIENQFLNVEISTDNIPEKSKELQEIVGELEQKEERWLELSMKLED
jgi:ATP-binding cassette subfamily F protein uup